MRCLVLLSSTYPFFCSVGCFHSRNKRIGRGRETQMKWEQKQEQSCQHKKRNGKKHPSNQRRWKHQGSLPLMITAIPTSKCLQVRSEPLLECCTLENVTSWALRRLCECGCQCSTDCYKVLTLEWGNIKKFTWAMYTSVSLFWFENKILKQLSKWVVDLGFVSFLFICLIGARN